MGIDRQDDQAFELARDTWRQFYHYHVDLPVPSQPEIDARLIRYQHVESVYALHCFIAASLLLVAVGHAGIRVAEVFADAGTLLDAALFLITCAVFVVATVHALSRVQEALERRQVAMRIHVDGVDWDAVRSMFADATNPRVREYLAGVYRQNRMLRRAEAAVLMERMHEDSVGEEADDTQAFCNAVRGRDGVKPRELATAGICVLVVLLASPAARIPPDVLLPGLFVLGAWALADALGSMLQYSVDPWQLRSGGGPSYQLRRRVLQDLSPPLALLVGITALHAGVAGW